MGLPKLERYNQAIWAIIGTGVVVMVLIGMLIGAVEMFGSVFRGSGSLPVAMVDESADSAQDAAGHYEFCQPIAVHGSPYQLIRVASDKLVVRNIAVAKNKPKGFSSSDVYGSSPFETCGFNRSGKTSAVVNVMMRNADTGAMHLALNENAVIYTLAYPSEKSDNDNYSNDFPPLGVLFWEIAYTDSSGDGVIDDDDDVGAYLSDADGRNLKRITPVPSRVLERTYDKTRRMLMLRVMQDTNGDRKLNEDDDTSLIESSVASRAIVREVLNTKSLSELMRSAEPKQLIPQDK